MAAKFGLASHVSSAGPFDVFQKALNLAPLETRKTECESCIVSPRESWMCARAAEQRPKGGPTEEEALKIEISSKIMIPHSDIDIQLSIISTIPC